MTRTIDLATIPGDGIGPEVIAEAVETLRTALGGEAVLQVTEYPFSARHYLQTGDILSDDDLAALAQHEVMLLGAVGGDPRDPRLAGGIIERGLLLKLRFAFDHYVNLRPTRIFPGVTSPLSQHGDVDFVVVREGTEGPYTGNGGRFRSGTAHEVATEVSINTAYGVERVVRYAFELAEKRRKKVTMVHKTNVLTSAGQLWQRLTDAAAAEHPGVAVDYLHVDAATIFFVTDPARFDVIVTDNLFGDLLSDLAAVIQGGMGLAPSANLNVHGRQPSMFEPVHGSAPDIAGTGGANPAGAIFAAAMCLSHLGEHEAAAALERATIQVLATLPAMRGPQMGCTTSEIGERVCDALTLDAEPGEVGTYRSRTVVAAKGRKS